MSQRGETPAALRRRAERVRQLADEFRAGDPAIPRLMALAAELDARAVLLEGQEDDVT